LSIWAFATKCKKDGFGNSSDKGCNDPLGIKCSKDKYCDLNGICQNLKKPGDYCKNPHECENRLCIEGQCRHENELYCDCEYAVSDVEPTTGRSHLKKVGPGYCSVKPGDIQCLHKDKTIDAYSYCYNGPDLETAPPCIAKLK